MAVQIRKKDRKVVLVTLLGLLIVVCTTVVGCKGTRSYSNESLFPDEVTSVYLEMFDNQSFRRGVEYELTDAIGKRIEAETPYKIVSDRNKADTVLSGQIASIDGSVLTLERQTGRALEKDLHLEAVVSWKNLKTGELLIDRKSVTAAASYSEWQRQGFEYGGMVAANRLAQKIVELMEKEW
jgi:hypothetical protein